MITGANDSNSAFKPLNSTNERKIVQANIWDNPEFIDKDRAFDFDESEKPAEPMLATCIKPLIPVFEKTVINSTDAIKDLSKDTLSSLSELWSEQIAFEDPKKVKEESKMHQVHKPENDKPKTQPEAYNPIQVIEQAIKETSTQIMQKNADIAMGLAGRQITEDDAETAGFSNRSYALKNLLTASTGAAIFRADLEQQKQSEKIKDSIKFQEIQLSNVDLRQAAMAEKTAGGSVLTTAG